MHTKYRYPSLVSAAFFLVALMLTVSGVGLRQALAAPAAATLPLETCTLTAPLTRTCELWATVGSITLPGQANPVTIWGYTNVDPGLGGVAQMPGPALIANQGETINVILHNTLAETTSVSFVGQGLLPDLSGVLAGDVITYTFTVNNPGIFKYEAGPLPNAQHQVPMGMFGPLVVRPSGAANQAYSSTETAFDDEALIVLSEIDPALNNSADPSAFDMRYFNPSYKLINGKVYPSTDVIESAPGRRVLLRYLNAGQQSHTMALLGVYQKTLSFAGEELPFYRQVVSEILSPGETTDAIVTLPATPPAGTQRYTLYDASLLLNNSSEAGFGGMLTFITIPDGSIPGDTLGPAVSSLAAAPSPTNGSVDVTLSGTISDLGRGDSNIIAAGFFIDTPGMPITGTLMSAADGLFDSLTEGVTAVIPTTTLSTLSSGTHPIYVHGKDASGNWSAYSIVYLELDKTGPATTGLSLNPAVSSGNISVAIQATGNDSTTGNGNIAAAEYFIDAQGADGSGIPMTINLASPIASLTGIIDQATMATLIEGAHTVIVHSQDALGNWGPVVSTELGVDKTGPVASNTSVYPSPNNGTLGVNPVTPSVRVNVTLTDNLVSGAGSNISRAEGFIDTVIDPPGTGFAFTPLDGAFNSPVESAYAFIPLSQVKALTEGTHTIYMRGKDTAGNWGEVGNAILIVDKTKPTVSGVSASPNPTGGAASVTLTATANDPVSAAPASNIVRGEWFEGADPGLGRATSMTATDNFFNSPSEGLTAVIDVSGFTIGNHTLSVRTRDAAGNWSLVSTVVLVIQPPDLIFANGFESGNLTGWSSSVGNVSASSISAMVGTYGMQAVVAGNTPAYVVDTSPANEASYHARFYFNPHGTLTGNTQMEILSAKNAAGQTIFRIQYRRTNAGGGTYQVRLSVQRAGGATNTNWFTIANNTAHSIELSWQSATAASAQIYIDGVLRQTLTNLNTSAFRVESVWLGPSAGLVAAASGTMYLDEFESRRYTIIGP